MKNKFNLSDKTNPVFPSNPNFNPSSVSAKLAESIIPKSKINPTSILPKPTKNIIPESSFNPNPVRRELVKNMIEKKDPNNEKNPKNNEKNPKNNENLINSLYKGKFLKYSSLKEVENTLKTFLEELKLFLDDSNFDAKTISTIVHNMNLSIMDYKISLKKELKDFWKMEIKLILENKELFKKLLTHYKENSINSLLFLYEDHINEKTFKSAIKGLLNSLNDILSKQQNEDDFIEEYLSYTVKEYINTYIIYSLINNQENWIENIKNFFNETLDWIYKFKFRDRTREVLEVIFKNLKDYPITNELVEKLIINKIWNINKLVRLAAIKSLNIDDAISFAEEYGIGLRSGAALLKRLIEENRKEEFDYFFKIWKKENPEIKFKNKTANLDKNSEEFKKAKEKYEEDKLFKETNLKEIKKLAKENFNEEISSKTNKNTKDPKKEFDKIKDSTDINKLIQYINKANFLYIFMLIEYKASNIEFTEENENLFAEKQLKEIIRKTKDIHKLLFILHTIKENIYEWQMDEKLQYELIKKLVNRKDFDFWVFIAESLNNIFTLEAKVTEKKEKNWKTSIEINEKYAKIFFAIFLKSIPYEKTFMELFPSVVNDLTKGWFKLGNYIWNSPNKIKLIKFEKIIDPNNGNEIERIVKEYTFFRKVK